MWGAMVDYWYYTEDPTYNEVVAQAILSQASPTNDFMMRINILTWLLIHHLYIACASANIGYAGQR